MRKRACQSARKSPPGGAMQPVEPADPASLRRAFRDALGSFATGVTIATTLAEDEAPVGVTASSFNSVSLDPPLVLWSLAKSAQSRAAFTSSGHFAVHVLAASQQDLSDRFARSGVDKFAGLEWEAGELGSPLFPDFAARFECKTRHEYEGGDHVILVGEVVAFEANDVPPLLFHAGSYARRRFQARDAAQDILNEVIAVEHALEKVARGDLPSGRMEEMRALMRRIVDLSN